MAEAEVDGVRVHYERLGAGAPVVLVHGLGGTGETIWKNHAAALARRFDVVVPDLRGTGRSASPPGSWSLADFVSDLEGLRRVLGLERIALVGHSFGGSIALAYAVAYPERVTAVVAAGGPTEFPDATREALRARAETVEREGVAVIAETVATNGMAPSFRVAHPDEFRSYVALLEANDPTSYAATCRVIAELDLGESLGRIAAPALLIAGDQDGVAPPALNRATASRIAGASFVEVEDCGHIIPWERPDELTDAVLAFLEAAP